MISLEQLFERLGSITENNISLASTSGSSYGGYYGGDGGGSTTITVYGGYIARLKDLDNREITTTLTSSLKCGTFYAPTRQVDGASYAFFAVAKTTAISTGTSFTWGNLVDFSTTQYTNTTNNTDVNFSTNELAYCYYITSGGDTLYFLKQSGGTFVDFSSAILSSSYTKIAATVRINKNYPINVYAVSLKSQYSTLLLPLLGTSADTIEGIVMHNTSGSGHSATYFDETANTTYAKFYGAEILLSDYSNSTYQTTLLAKAKAVVSTNISTTNKLVSSSVTSANPYLLTYWPLGNSYRPVRGVNPIYQQIPTNIPTSGLSDGSMNSYVEGNGSYYNRASSLKYFPILPINCYDASNSAGIRTNNLYIYNYEIFYIRVFVVQNGTIVTGSDLSNYKIKWGSYERSLVESSFGDSTLYDESITKTPSTTFKSTKDGDTISDYSSKTQSCYFGLLRPYNISNTSSLTLSLKSGNEVLGTLTNEIEKTTNTYYMNYFVFNLGSPKLYIGSDDVKKVYIGNTQVKLVWIGNTQIYP